MQTKIQWQFRLELITCILIYNLGKKIYKNKLTIQTRLNLLNTDTDFLIIGTDIRPPIKLYMKSLKKHGDLESSKSYEGADKISRGILKWRECQSK